MNRVRTNEYVLGRHLQQKNPFIMDTRFHDVPNTVRGFIRALPKNCIAVSLRLMGGQQMIKVAEREARHKGIRILWL